MKQETLEIANRQYIVRIYIERRKTSLCSIGKNINIRLPLFLSSEDKLAEIERMKQWATSQIQKNPPISQIFKKYNSGDTITLQEKTYTLVISTRDSKSSSGRLKGDNIVLKLSSSLIERRREEEISKLISKIISKERLSHLQKKIRELNSQYFNLPLGEIRFKNQKTRWGSCSQKRNINISSRLLLAPEDVLEYVCIHELAHLKEHNHSEAFWSIIRSIDPSYKDKHKWLKRNGKDLII
jgi:predicted metal-dependent hydrolase